ncbi:carboxypeptidase-like regulatory domain-containing protein [Flavobacterium commune]|uniref:TonB-dependent receptor plug domain-containing protein n=1 Tax=Flavobacterium commune TaxID=1306519 RepID=A0A1D9PAJ4_9FLAO|nr:carboxypeptidase-like regulatory domain-containing protein [Flavobacterium commune]AOZ99593.1 hypothetical protein BIW12_09150 [Flavobacterium commune]
MANYFTQLLHDSQSLYTPLTTSFNTATPAATRINVSGVVIADDGESLPGANISVNGVAKIQTNGNGYFSLTNILSTDIIKVSYIGYEDYESKAADLPKAINMLSSAEALNEVTVYAKPKNKTNWLLWLGIGTGLGLIAYKIHSAKATVKAKI